jgi:hypothetical protein
MFVLVQIAEVEQLVAEVAVDVDQLDAAGLAFASGALRRLLGWCEGREAAIARRLCAVVPVPEQAIADAGRTGRRHASRVLARASTGEAVPQFGEALAGGAVRGDHLDVLGRTLAGLEPDQRVQLTEDVAWLVGEAERSSPEEFARTLQREVRRLDDDDGTKRLERQRRDTRLRTWVDRETGMWHLAGRFDPASALVLDAALRSKVAALFADATPSTCPTDPLERQDHLRALALLGLVEGDGLGAVRMEIVAVLDATVLDAEGLPRVDWGLPVELPPSLLAKLFGTARVHPVVVGNGVVLHAPGKLHLGRTTRIANRAQRRALRALYGTCSVPGCAVRFGDCKIHHVHWWRHGGLTDLDNLLPVCVRHHHNIHDAGWQVALAADRSLTVSLPDGQVMTTGPPRRSAG